LGNIILSLDLGPPQTVIFFKVTHLELFPTSIPPPLQPTTQLKKHPNGSTANDVPIDEGEEDPEMSELLENAKLGAILDPNSTKLVQTGLEQTYVPNLAPSLGIRKSSSESIVHTKSCTKTLFCFVRNRMDLVYHQMGYLHWILLISITNLRRSYTKSYERVLNPMQYHMNYPTRF
jgi:hypothetical protein